MSESIIQIGDQARPMSDEEIAEWEKGVREDQEVRQQQKAAKESAVKKLVALGLTDAEITAILGA